VPLTWLTRTPAWPLGITATAKAASSGIQANSASAIVVRQRMGIGV